MMALAHHITQTQELPKRARQNSAQRMGDSTAGERVCARVLTECAQLASRSNRLRICTAAQVSLSSTLIRRERSHLIGVATRTGIVKCFATVWAER